ncbi:MAG: hypothetical protein MUC88_04115 [Planctomycetes bacterium]|jgi:type IV secretory pathway VirB10-like protein|nr:hypothetical protein [Planctomycetota bacterium]
MNSIWLKIAGAAVLAIVVIVVIGRVQSDKPASAPATRTETAPPERTFSDMVERDKQFNQPPQPVTTAAAQPAQEPAPPPGPTPPAQPPAAPATRPAGVVYPSDLKGPTTLYFMPLSEEDDIAAQQIFPYATAGRSMGRLPIMQYGLMMKACEQIEQRWPDSWYCFRAKQMMEEITQYQERYAQQYRITPQRLDISRFMKPRRGAEPREVRPIER